MEFAAGPYAWGPIGVENLYWINAIKDSWLHLRPKNKDVVSARTGSILRNKAEEISEEFLEEVELAVGMCAGAWDTRDPKEIIAAVINFWERKKWENHNDRT